MEFVYVIRRRDLFENGTLQGFSAIAPQQIRARYLDTIVKRGFFVERGHAETDSSLKQVIPYCIVCDRSSVDPQAPGALRVLCLRRLGRQGESRLHDKLSIGIGGHLNPEDYIHSAKYTKNDLGDPLRSEILKNGVIREVCEELAIDQAHVAAPTPIGILNDDASVVGTVHFGLVYAIEVPEQTDIREKEHMAGEWQPWSRLVNLDREGSNFETWSRFLLHALHERHILEALNTGRKPAGESKLIREQGSAAGEA